MPSNLELLQEEALAILAEKPGLSWYAIYGTDTGLGSAKNFLCAIELSEEQIKIDTNYLMGCLRESITIEKVYEPPLWWLEKAVDEIPAGKDLLPDAEAIIRNTYTRSKNELIQREGYFNLEFS